MKCTLQDDRTAYQKKHYTTLVVALDTFMSGWGGAKGGESRCAWACKDCDAQKVLAWVESRSDMKPRSIAIRHADTYKVPAGTAHFHIYVVRRGHPALS